MEVIETDFVKVYKCPICGNTFATCRPEMWAWKYSVVGGRHTRAEKVCSYHCMLEAEERENKKRKNKWRVR